ncbi:DNA polymerase III epsilon subunit-like protein [Bradyrhizobium sp. LM4.3]
MRVGAEKDEVDAGQLVRAALIDYVGSHAVHPGLGRACPDFPLRDSYLGGANVSRADSCQPVQVRAFDRVGIDQDVVADAEAGQLLDQHRSRAAQADHAHLQQGDRALPVGAESANLTVVASLIGLRGSALRQQDQSLTDFPGRHLLGRADPACATAARARHQRQVIAGRSPTPQIVGERHLAFVIDLGEAWMPRLEGMRVHDHHAAALAFVSYDVETTGLNKRFDQILQFAAVRTDVDLVETERFETRSRLMPQVAPSPKALHLTGTSLANATDMSRQTHYDMVCEIARVLSSWSPAVFLGFNYISFDEEFLRQACYQRLHPVFLTNTNQNARADVLNLLRAAGTLHPSVIRPGVGTDGAHVYKLGPIAAANGIAPRKARDAARDVDATLGLCRLVRSGAPELWSAFLRFSSKTSVVDFVRDEEAFAYFDFRGSSTSRGPSIASSPTRDEVAQIRSSEKASRS